VPVKAQDRGVVAQVSAAGPDDRSREVLDRLPGVQVPARGQDGEGIDRPDVALQHAVGQEHEPVAGLERKLLDAVRLGHRGGERQIRGEVHALGDGRFFFTDLPVLGVNPPKTTQPPYRPDVPCETQEGPDMRSQPQAPPQQIRINQHAPGADARRARVNKALMQWMRDELERNGAGEQFKLSDEPLKASEIPQVVKEVAGG